MFDVFKAPSIFILLTVLGYGHEIPSYLLYRRNRMSFTGEVKMKLLQWETDREKHHSGINDAAFAYGSVTQGAHVSQLGTFLSTWTSSASRSTTIWKQSVYYIS